jgi:conjugal transfer ATP-binding protein TraC
VRRNEAECSIAALLPYHSFDPGRRIFVQGDGSLGMVWRVEPVVCEASDEEEMGAAAADVAQLIRRVPEGWSLQAILRSSRDVGEELKSWSDAEEEGCGELYRALAESRVKAVAELEMADPAAGGRFVSRSLERYIGLLKPPAWGGAGWLSNIEETLKKSYERQSREMEEAASQIEAALGRLGMEHRRLDATELLNLARGVLNPGARRVQEDGRRLLREQVATGDFRADLETGEIRSGGMVHRVMSVKEVPLETFAGMLTLPLDAAARCTVSADLRIPPQREIAAKLKTRKRLVFSQMGTRDGQVEAACSREEIDSVLAEMFAQGEKVISARMTFSASAKEAGELDRTCRELETALGSAGLEVVREEALAPTLLLQSLPLASVEETDRAIKRSRVMTSSNAAHLLPVYGSYRGTGGEDLLLLNRRGEVAKFSFFDNETAPHGIVAGATGSGKSVLAQNLILSVLRRGARVVVLDRGNSYKRLCEIAGGEYLNFDVSRPVSINPFGKGCDAEKTVFLTHLVAELATHGDRDPTPKESGLIVKAIARAYERAAGGAVDLSDVQEALGGLSGEDEAAKDLSLSLELYGKRGPYGGFLNGESKLRAERFTVCELGELALRKEIASPILMALVFAITREYMARPEIDKYLVIDEAWTLLKTRNTARFLENVYRTYRKYRTSALMLTQQVGDFEGSVGEAIRANAPNRVYLKQTQETILAMEKLLDLSPTQKELLASVESVKGAFSEALYVGSNGQGVLRLVQDPLTYWITTSDPEDRARLQELMAGERTVLEALKEAAKEGRRGRERERGGR